MANGETREVAVMHVEATAAYDVTPGESFHPRGEANGYILTLGRRSASYVVGVTGCWRRFAAHEDVVAFFPHESSSRPDGAGRCDRLHQRDEAEGRVPLSPIRNGCVPLPAAHGLEPTTRGLKELSDALGDQKIEVRLATWYPQ